MRKLLKFLHTLAATGMIGALASHIILLTIIPEPTSLEQYAALRLGIAAIAKWLLFPSLGLVLVSGLLAMAFSNGYHSAGWAWLKLGLGVVTFEGTLLTVQGPAIRAADASIRALEGSVDPGEISAMVRGEWNSLWVILAIAVVNVILGVWRPRLSRAPRGSAPLALTPPGMSVDDIDHGTDTGADAGSLAGISGDRPDTGANDRALGRGATGEDQ